MLKTPIIALPFLKVLGDSHLGRRFLEGVPIHRRGEREAGMRGHFYKALTEGVTDQDLIVQTGDIFDSYSVPFDVILDAYRSIDEAQKQTGASYVVLRGNHDAVRDTAKRSAFDILQALFEGNEFVVIASETHWILHQEKFIGLMPWHPFKPAQELAVELAEMAPVGKKFDAVFTHCDLDSFGENTFNLMPYEELSKITDAVVNGHIHSPEERNVNGTRFIMVGSMEPYSHGEDPEGQFYVTMTLEELFKTDPEKLKQKHLRILLGEGENIPDELPDCLSVTSKRVKSKEEIVEDDSEVTMEAFSLSNIISDCLKKSGVSDKISTQILTKFEESKNAA